MTVTVASSLASSTARSKVIVGLFFAAILLSLTFRSRTGATDAIVQRPASSETFADTNDCIAAMSFPTNEHPLHVFWPAGLVGFAKEDQFWIYDLLGNVHRPLFVHVYDDKAPANVSDVFRSLRGDLLLFGFGDVLNILVSAATDAGRQRIGVFHLGDEGGTHNKTFYASPIVAFVLRTYYFERIQEMAETLRKPILWVPNGYNELIGPRQLSQHIPATMRSVLCYFEGSMRGAERAELVRLLQGPLDRLACRLQITPGFNQGLASLSYTSALQNSKFVLCPAGNSVETIRLYEAMENGAIPVMLNHTSLRIILKDVPVIFLDSWQELDGVLTSVTANPETLRSRQEEVVRGWFKLKSALRKKIALLVNGLTNNT